MTISNELLRAVRCNALRKRVWYKALDELERNLVNLTINVVESVKSLTLAREITKILVKLRDASRSAFTRHYESYGPSKLVDIINVALSFGNEQALYWWSEGFAKHLAVNNINNPVGWRQAAA